MTISNELMLAILAMDAYNEGYASGVQHVGTQIGAATLLLQSNVDPQSDEVAAGFYAAAYKLADGTTVIAYRGTDFLFETNGIGGDALNGYGVGAGSPLGPQAALAVQFYNAVKNVPGVTNVIVTGHSLGGGLAGYVGSLYGLQGALFDNMTFNDAAKNAQEWATAAYNGDVPVMSGDHVVSTTADAQRLLSDIYGGQKPWPLVNSNLGAFAVTGELLQFALALRAFQNPSVTRIDSHGGIRNPVDLHSIALLAALSWAQENNKTYWQAIGPDFIDALFNDRVAQDAGVTGLQGRMIEGGAYAAAELAAIAYSAVDPASAGKPFGDSAIFAAFDDADQLGKVSTAGANPLIRSSNGVIPALAKIAVQYAGDVALQKSTSADDKRGAFEQLANGAILQANLDPQKWKSTFNTGSTELSHGEEKIVGVQDLVRALTKEAKLDPGSAAFAAEIDQLFADSAKWGPLSNSVANLTQLQIATTATGVTFDASDAAKAKNGADGGAMLVGGEGDDVFTGSKGDDLEIGGKGADTFYSSGGADLMFGGYGNDSYIVKLGVDGAYQGGVTFFGGADSGGKSKGNADFADYTAVKGKVEVSYDKTLLGLGPDDKSRATVKVGNGREDKLYGVETIDTGAASDTVRLKNFGSIWDLIGLFNPIGSANAAPVIDLGGQGVDLTPTGSIASGGDEIDLSELPKGLLINLRDENDQFVTDIVGKIPTRLGRDGAVPTNSLQAAKLLADVAKEIANPTDLSNYGKDNRLDLKNVESAFGTDASDLIIGADTVYTWKTPEPDPNASPDAPPPAPQRVVDVDFRGYDLEGGGGNDTIIVYKGNKDQVTWHLIDGGDGNDVIVAKDYGDQFYTDPDTGQQTRSEIRGGAGDDVIFSVGAGVGGDVIGGEGSDLLMNTAYKGRIWGDSKDGTGAHSSDVFWWSAGTFIMDAGTANAPERRDPATQDMLQMFGLPLTGGTNTIAGLPSGQTKWAYDWVLPFVRYGLSDSNQLIVQSWLGNIVDHKLRTSPSDEILKSSMIVENYHFGEGGNWAHPARGDLNMTFRIVTRDNGPNAMNGFYSVWGALIAELDALLNFAKMLKWKTPDDPLVLDLDGDGIETTSKDQGGVHFDMNGDHFAELNGWVGADDGFLVMDRDGNGRIDDVSELFGRPGGSGFAELRLLDDTGDGRIDASDAAFAKIQVWRDLDQDGVSDAGEVFGLADLGIASLDAVGAPLGVTTPSGNLLREQATFTRTDGRKRKIFGPLRTGQRRKSKSRYWDRRNVPPYAGKTTKMARNQLLTIVKVSLVCNSREG